MENKWFTFINIRVLNVNLSFILQMTNIDKLHEMVKASLLQFVNKHIRAADLSVVDEIVLNYVIAILEEATEDPNFDVEGEQIRKIFRKFFSVW